jgi:hypothetical protein
VTGRLLLCRRGLLAMCVIASAWAVFVGATGGVVVRSGALRFSSRTPWPAAAVAVCCLLAATAMRLAPSARTTLREEWAWWSIAIRRAAHPLRVLLVPSVALAVFIGAYDISQWLRAPPFWADEEMIAINLRDRRFAELTGALWLGQSAPLAWLLLQRIVLVVLGATDVVLRLVPLLFGIATVGAASWVGERWLHRTSAALLVLLCGLGYWLSYFRFEMKHYSADAFWALLLPALGAWALERIPGGADERRWTHWWIAAAAGQFFANGALLATPMCALVMMLVIAADYGWRPARRFALTGLIWLGATAINYQLALQFTSNSKYLRTYWAPALPSEAAPFLDKLAWVAGRLDTLAVNPGGTALAVAFWMCAACGFLFTRQRTLGMLFATVPLSAFILAVLRMVPLSDRLSLWIVPALYAGVALLFEALRERAVRAWRTKAWRTLTLCAVAGAVPLWVSGDILNGGKPALEFSPLTSNHGLDDRSAVNWIMQRRQPGDALLTTHLGWPAIWWYGGISLGSPIPRGTLPDGSAMYEIVHERARVDCGERIRQALQGHRRVIVHVGFPDMPDGFYDLALRELRAFGPVVEFKEFADFSRVAVLTFTDAANADRPAPQAGQLSAGRLPGCLAFRAARRW